MHINFLSIATISSALFFSNTAFANWHNAFENQVALSGDESLSFACPPPGSDFLGPTFTAYISKPLPQTKQAELLFRFDTGKTVRWVPDNSNELYIGPMYGINDNADKILGYEAALRFGPTERDKDRWKFLTELFMEKKSVIVIANGVEHGPISLKGSSKSLRHIAYFEPPC
ncbi:hypothetical protein GCM10008927_27250 [Amylibacter ulvae]|uniref:Secreted protein n=1 Tax=Paramylibacter ulvae TaxID=1651968 RepID=A0ABQ3D747_9RHOB|nr:hypothetical protein [Amylibacter ulvae]GHA60271.1 hypothetical protein GCM10008927_27250 [Amylibacter ulvae]